MRECTIKRETKETNISLHLDLDGMGNCQITTGIGFFDHMLTALSVHSGFDLDIQCKGDIHVDSHHTIEDVGIVLGTAFAKTTENKLGIGRYGSFTVPMDEALASCNVDISGRPHLTYRGDFSNAKIGELDTQMIKEFFYAFAMHAKVTLHMNLLYGENDHHKAEAMFKSFAHALRQAVALGERTSILSTKGSLT